MREAIHLISVGKATRGERSKPDFRRRVIEYIQSGDMTVAAVGEQWNIASSSVYRWRRQLESDRTLQLQAGIAKAVNRLEGILKEWRGGRLIFVGDKAVLKSGKPDESKFHELPIMRAAMVKATPTGRAFLHDAAAQLSEFKEAASSKELILRWSADLYRLCRKIAGHNGRWQPRRAEVLVLNAALPQRAQLDTPPNGAGPARQSLHRDVERWARSEGLRRPPSQYAREKSLWDSYWTTELMMREVREYGDMIRDLWDRSLIDEGDTLISPEVGRRVDRELDFLLALLELRRGIDVQRSLLLRRGTLRPFVPVVIDAELRATFERIIQGIPLYIGAVPDRGTRDYARSAHLARDIVVDRYAKIHALPRSMGARYITASSAMALLGNLMIATSSLLQNGSLDPVRIGCLGHTYFETRELAKRLTFLRKELKLVRIEPADAVNSEDVDVLLVETIGNHPDAVALESAWLRGFLQQQPTVKLVIADITLDPLQMKDLARCVSHDAVFVFVDSLTKYAQAGTNVAIAGIATIISGKSAEARKRAEWLQEWLREMTRLLGQHMDARLAVTLLPSRKILEERIRRMRRNATLIAGCLRKICGDRVNHASNAERASTLIYLTGRINWAAVGRRELARFRSWRKGPKRTEAFLMELERGSYLRDVGEGVKSAAIVRLSTSFGFSATSVHSRELPHRIDEFWVRVSAGIESVEHLEFVIQFRIAEFLPFLTRDWELYIDDPPGIISKRKVRVRRPTDKRIKSFVASC